MYTVIDYVLKNLFETRHTSEAGDVCTYVTFQSDDDHDWVDGTNAALMFGRVKYLRNEVTFLWKPMLLKLTPQVINFPEFHVYAFTNETFFYTRIVPFFDKLKPIRHLFPKFYTSYVEMNEDDDKSLLVFENLISKGYYPLRRKSFLDFEYLKLMMRKLGEMHAYSYKAAKVDPDYFLPLAASFQEIHFAHIRKLKNLLSSSSRGLECLRGDPKYASKLANVEKILKNAEDFISKLFTSEKEKPMSVICHGQYASGNVMFKHENDKPVDMKIIDLAVCKFASPVVDLSSVLYLNADQSMRDQHWDDLINEYYSSLSNTFPEDVPSKEAILQEFKTKSLLAYFAALVNLVQAINVDLKLPKIKDTIPSKYRDYGYSDLPVDVHLSIMKTAGGPQATEALANILKDMIDRGFV